MKQCESKRRFILRSLDSTYYCPIVIVDVMKEGGRVYYTLHAKCSGIRSNLRRVFSALANVNPEEPAKEKDKPERSWCIGQ